MNSDLKILPTGEGETINFSNGIKLDYIFTDYDPNTPHRVSGSIHIYDESLGDILEDIKTLQCVAYILEKCPDAKLEIVHDETKEYIFYLTEDQIHKLMYL